MSFAGGGWRIERVANRAVKVEGAGGAVGGTKTDHATRSGKAPPLASAFHTSLKHMAMRALDDARADGEPSLAESAVLHALLVRAVVPNDVVERGELFLSCG